MREGHLICSSSLEQQLVAVERVALTGLAQFAVQLEARRAVKGDGLDAIEQLVYHWRAARSFTSDFSHASVTSYTMMLAKVLTLERLILCV